MVLPALAPAAAVLALEGAGLLAARYAVPQVTRGPLVLPEREVYLRVGDNWATRAGRRAHEALKARVREKAGWEAERPVRTQGGVVRPDVSGPVRKVAPSGKETRYQMELKPNTPSGRRAGAKAAARYTRETETKTRPIYYNPKDYM